MRRRKEILSLIVMLALLSCNNTKDNGTTCAEELKVTVSAIWKDQYDYP